MPRLEALLDDAIDDFVDRMMRYAPIQQAKEPSDVSALGHEVLLLVSKHPEGLTANQLTDATDVGLAPMFQELRELMASNHLVRILRGDDQLPVYVLPSAS